MAEELIHLGQYLDKILDNNKTFLIEKYNKEQLIAIEEFCNIVGEDSTKSNLFLKQLVFVNILEKSEPEPEPEVPKEHVTEQSDSFLDMLKNG